ncbi:hypothetical protein ACQPX6_08815 [Actinomycetospora sp. CA-101289]|uniref:hypothetical protein n=1 Tax=Actinomycetospora sp. CA-101289 TaxID=3239893 RepID=UPI003D975E70
MLAEWLGRAAGGLVGPARWRADVLVELRDGLLEATEHHLAGLGDQGGADADRPRWAAARAAVAEFGDPEVVAAGFVSEEASARAQWVGRAVLASGPLAAAGWCITFVAGGAPMLHGRLAGPWWALPLLGVVLAAVIPAAVAVGFPFRWALRELPPGSALAHAELAAWGTAAADAVMLGLLVLWVAAGPTLSVADLGPAVLAGVVVSLIRLPSSGMVAWSAHARRARLRGVCGERAPTR